MHQDPAVGGHHRDKYTAMQQVLRSYSPSLSLAGDVVFGIDDVNHLRT